VHDLDIDYPYSELEFIQNLPAYNSSKGLDEMLDLQREIQTSGNYYWQGVGFPIGDATTVDAFATVNGTIQVPVGTYVTGITHFESGHLEGPGPGIGGGGFKIRIWDKGSQASIFYGDYCLNRIVSSNMQIQYGVGDSNPPTDQGSNLDNPFGPGLLMEPFIINEPGVLGWEIVNLDSISETFQVMLSCAVPVNLKSIGQTVVSK
jgi:hypothetical protein